MRMSELPISRRKFCKNKTGMNTKTRIRNPVARPRSNRGRGIEVRFSCENGAGRSAVAGILENRGSDIVAESEPVGVALSGAGVGDSRSGVPFPGCEQGSVSSFGEQDGVTNFLSGVSDSLVCVSHGRI